MSMYHFRGAVAPALMVTLVLGTGTVAQAQNDQPEGPVIQIGKADPQNAGPQLPPPNEGPDLQNQPGTVEAPAAPKYWIGLVGGPIGEHHPLRAHLDIPEHEGLLVASVVPDSPAAKAGLKQNDILLRANDTELREMQDLVELVRTAGEKQGQIAIEVLRRGQRETVYITPEERPTDATPPQGNFGHAFGQDFGLPNGAEFPQDLLREFGDVPFEFRQFGPGVIVGGGGSVADLPNGVSVSITKEDNQPARITVKRGEDTWEIVGDDPASLNQLPEDLRPFVDQMLHGQSRHAMSFGHPGRAISPELGEGRLRERLDRIERRMQELQERLMGRQSPLTYAPQGQDADTK
jgi:membrane-associated protease RseP (regulator of RpoE activity)